MDFKRLSSIRKCIRVWPHTHTQSVDCEPRQEFTLGNRPLPSVTVLRLDEQRQAMGQSPFSTNLPNLFAESKWLREAFSYRQENLRQVVLWEAIEWLSAKWQYNSRCRVRLIVWEKVYSHGCPWRKKILKFFPFPFNETIATYKISSGSFCPFLCSMIWWTVRK